MASSEKRCLYEVLGLKLDSTADEIRSAYKKMALQRHPDKLVKSGLSQAEATASFQELVNAYEVLSDPRERAWYDSHRSQILFSDPNSGSNSAVPDLFSYFSNSVFSGYSDSRKGFYKVYSEVFDKVYANELNFAKKLGLGLSDSVKEAPVMGNLDSPYTQATAFYNYWLGFATVMDFCWADQYDVMAGPNRKSRRVMEEENKKVRKKAKREYNDMVRGLAEFVKKRDKRVIDMQVKKGLEMEKKRELEKEKKRELEREKLERAMAYEEPEWARVEEEEEGFEDGVGDELEESEKRNEFYCVVCGKKFKSEKQWKNHEQSKKHKEKVAELRVAFEDELKEEVEREEANGTDAVMGGDVDENGFENDLGTAKGNGSIDELDEQFKDSCGIGDGEIENKVKSSDEGGADVTNDKFDHNSNDKTKVGESLGLEDERIDLESMLSGRRNRRKAAATQQPHGESQTNDDGEVLDFMEYDNRKITRKNKGGRRAKGKKLEADSMSADVAESNDQSKENRGAESSEIGESSSQSVVENEANKKRDHQSENGQNVTYQTGNRKGTTKKEDTNPKSRNLPKGRKSKATTKNTDHLLIKKKTKNTDHLCDTCGEDFESRNKLHKHLGETGHASLKYR